MLTEYEKQYMSILTDIYKNGYSDGINERTGLATKRIPCVTIRVDLEKEFPILKSKQVFSKTAEREILWIWQQMSNNVNDLKAKIWDEWANTDGSIGKAYGYQMAKQVKINEGSLEKPNWCEYPNQTSFVLEHLKKFPNSRRVSTTLWNTEDLPDMNLVPCVYSTSWNLDGGRLNMIVVQRSGDMPYGVPFNTTQYAMLLKMIARHIGVKAGVLLHVITDAHIYANQMNGVDTQIKRYELMQIAESNWDKFKQTIENNETNIDALRVLNVDNAEQAIGLMHKVLQSAPKFEIRSEVESFWDMNVDNAHMCGYENLGRIDFGDIAV